MSQGVRDLGILLEATEQELKTIGLENIEYQREIYELKKQNTVLMEENEEHLESVQLEQQEILYLRSVSVDFDVANLYNEDLNLQISQYQQMVKELKTENKELQEHNIKYKITLEQIYEEKEGRNKIYDDNLSKLKNQIKDLETDCDELREELNALNTAQMTQIHYDEKQYTHDVSSRKSSVFRLRNHSIRSNYDDINLNEDIMSELLQFGYIEDDIMNAMKSVHNTNDINDIVEYIENESHHEYDADIKTKMEEISILKCTNTENERKINKMRRKITLLQRQNNALLSKRDDRTCWVQWFG